MSRIVPALIVAIGLAAAGWFTGRGLFEARATSRYVTVKGVAERAVEADVAVWPLTIAVSSDALDDAHAQLARHLDAVDAFFARHGIEATQVSRQGFNVNDTHANRWGTGKPGIRYTITQTLVVRSDAPETILAASADVSSLLAAGVVLQSGGPYQAGPNFLFTRLNELKPDMIAEATARAREAADEFAEDSGARVGGIRRAHQGVFQILARDRVGQLPEAQQLHKVVRVVSTIEYLLEE